MTSPTNLKPSEVAEELRLSEQTLANWRWQGSGPRWIKAGGRVLYPRADLNAWLNESSRAAS